MTALASNSTYRIEWICGYGDSDGKSEILTPERINADNGFQADEVEELGLLEVGKCMYFGCADSVRVTRLS